MTGERVRLLSGATLYASYAELGNDDARKGDIFGGGGSNGTERGKNQQSSPSNDATRPLPSLCSRVLTIGVLVLLHIIILCNRQVISAVFPFVQSYFSVSDSSSGLLEATEAPLNAFCLLLYGALDGRYNRKWLIIGAMLFWSAMSAAASFASRSQFWLFCLLRAFNGIGDAAVATLTLPIIGEYLQGSKRGYAIMFYSTSSLIANTIAMSTSSVLVEWGVSWQWLLRLPLPLIAASLLILLLFMPNSRGARTQSPFSFFELLQSFRRLFSVRSYKYLLLAQFFQAPMYLSDVFWTSTLLKRAMDMFEGTPDARIFHGLGFAAVMTLTSSVGAATAIGGIFAGTAFADAWQNGRGCFGRWGRSRLRAPALTTLGCAILYSLTFTASLFLLTRDIIAYIVVYLFSTGVGSAAVPINMHIMLDTVPLRQRALACAVQPLMMSIINSAVPLAIGAISDGLRGGFDDFTSRYFSLFWAMVGASILTATVTPLMLSLLSRHYAEDVEIAVAEEDHGQSRRVFRESSKRSYSTSTV